MAGQEHPYILHRRAIAAIVEINQVRSIVRPENIAGVTVAMQTNDRIFDSCHELAQQRQQVCQQGLIRRQQGAGYEVMFQDETRRFMHITVEADVRPRAEGMHRPQGMHAPQGAADAV